MNSPIPQQGKGRLGDALTQTHTHTHTQTHTHTHAHTHVHICNGIMGGSKMIFFFW